MLIKKDCFVSTKLENLIINVAVFIHMLITIYMYFKIEAKILIIYIVDLMHVAGKFAIYIEVLLHSMCHCAVNRLITD